MKPLVNFTALWNHTVNMKHVNKLILVSLLPLALAILDSTHFQPLDAVDVGGTSEYPKDLKCGIFLVSNRSVRGHLECSVGCFQDGCSVWALDTTNATCTVCQRCVGDGGGLSSATRDARRDSAIKTEGGCLIKQNKKEKPVYISRIDPISTFTFTHIQRTRDSNILPDPLWINFNPRLVK